MNSNRAQRDIASIYEWLQAEHAGDAGEIWFVGLRTAIRSLTNLPSRCPPAPESRESPVEVRQLLYGRRPHVYRILFGIEGNVVNVFHVRHARRRPLRRLVNKL